jgi:hypothetical protein
LRRHLAAPATGAAFGARGTRSGQVLLDQQLALERATEARMFRTSLRVKPRVDTPSSRIDTEGSDDRSFLSTVVAWSSEARVRVPISTVDLLLSVWGARRMGSTLLVVGRLPGRKERYTAGTYLARASDAALTSDAQAGLSKAWKSRPQEDGLSRALNEASTCAFVEHSAALEGLKGFNYAITRGRWRRLPYWIDSYWLPVRSNTKLIVRDKYEWPAFFGSAYGLLANLADIAAASPHGLGTVSPQFERMRTDLRAFYSLELRAFDAVTTLQWVWRALFEVATHCVERNVPMATGVDDSYGPKARR